MSQKGVAEKQKRQQLTQLHKCNFNKSDVIFKEQPCKLASSFFQKMAQKFQDIKTNIQGGVLRYTPKRE